jgi:type I pantothenate kinase
MSKKASRHAQTEQYTEYTREEWSGLRNSTPLTLDENDLANLRGINENIDLAEVADVYLPLTRFLNLHYRATQEWHTTQRDFLGPQAANSPYIIGLAGSVAVGKSTTARILQTLLARWPEHPKVELVTTDGFLYPNRVLEERNLMHRKGFPESYDLRRLLQFLEDVKGGLSEVVAPVYSHLEYDVLLEDAQIVRQPDIVILEGINVLQVVSGRFNPRRHVLVSDYFDFSLYVDAAEDDIFRWFLERFQKLRATAFRDPASFFHRYAAMSEGEAQAFALKVWNDINGVNLRENILPTRQRARLILEKGHDHKVRMVKLRKN